MERKGLIRYNKDISKYNLGFKLLEYGDTLIGSQDILQESELYLIELYKKVRQTVLMAIIDNDSLVYIFKREKGTEGLVYSSFVGQRRHLLYGALGRTALAFMPKQKINEILNDPLPQWTPNSITNKEDMLKSLENIRTERLCSESDEASIGVTAVASPIFGFDGKLIAVLGVLCPTVQTNESMLKEIKNLTKETTQVISQKMGYKGNEF